MESNREQNPGLFPQTLWTVVREAASGDDEASRRALERLCVIYREPARWWLLRSGSNPQQVDDLVQSFIVHLLSDNRLKGFQRREAKFRSFIIECLKRFRHDQWRKATAEKRGGGHEEVSLDDVDLSERAEIVSGLDTEFALAVHRRACARLRAKFEKSGKLSRYKDLRPVMLGGEGAVSYEVLGERLGLKPNAVKKAVFDLRDSYYEAFRAEVEEITTSDSSVEEMRYLLTLLAKVEPKLTADPPVS